VLAKVLTKVFFHDGTYSTFRGRVHGRPVPPSMTGHPFVVYLQDHDQVGNRATGDRISATLSDGLLKVGAALVMTSPYTPMLWMGEEWGAARRGSSSPTTRASSARRCARAAARSSAPTAGTPRRSPTRSRADVPRQHPRLVRARAAAARRPAGLEPLARRPAPLALELSDGRRDLVQVTYDEDARWLVVRRGGCTSSATSRRARQVPVPGDALEVVLESEPGSAFGPGRVELPASRWWWPDLAP
jgi:maltooligosyltrehalose trehalohydrolase